MCFLGSVFPRRFTETRKSNHAMNNLKEQGKNNHVKGFFKYAVVRKHIPEKDDTRPHQVSTVFLHGNSGLESRSKGVIQETLKKTSFFL